MGADNFETWAYGKTPADAFSAAHDWATWEHGHGGYSGTIAEKGSFVVVDTLGVKPTVFLELLEEAVYKHIDGSHADYMAREAAKWGVGALKRYGGKTLKQWQAQAAKDRREAERFWARCERRKPGLRAALEKAARVWGDKWGAAVCVGPVTGKAERDFFARGHAIGLTSRTVQDTSHGNTVVLRSVPAKPRGAKLWIFCGLASS